MFTSIVESLFYCMPLLAQSQAGSSSLSVQNSVENLYCNSVTESWLVFRSIPSYYSSVCADDHCLYTGIVGYHANQEIG